MLKKLLSFFILLISIQTLTLATTSSDKNICKICANNDPIQIRDLKNGYSQVRTKVGGSETYEIMNSTDAIIYKKMFNEGFKNLHKRAAEIKKQEMIKRENSKIVTKRIAILTSSGIYIALEENKNGEDFLVIDNQRALIANNLVNSQFRVPETITSKESSNNLVQNPTEWPLVEAYRIDCRDAYGKQVSYAEFIAKMEGLDNLFKIVYRLRDEYGVSYTDAQRLMNFRDDSHGFNPEYLLLPEEIGEKIYQKRLKIAENEFKNLKFPNTNKKSKIK